MPGSENHSHQLGSNPVETKAQQRSLTESAPLVKHLNKFQKCEHPGASEFRGCRVRKLQGFSYFTSTVAPASVNFFLIVSASSLLTPSLIGLGAPSTRSLASFRPRLVTSRTALITLIVFAPTAVKTTEN